MAKKQAAAQTFGLEGFAALSEADQAVVAELASRAETAEAAAETAEKNAKEASKTADAAEKKLAEAVNKSEAAEKTVETQKALIDKLNNSVDSKSKGAEFPVKKLGEVEYELVVASSTLDGKVINDMTLQDDSDELKKLVKIKSGVIREKR